jgi:hypothetical protein
MKKERKMTDQNIVTALTSMLDKLSNLDKDWVTFVTDHKNFVIENSNVMYMDDADRDRYKYKLDHYLNDKGCDKSIIWIAVLINDLASYEDFINKPIIYIPNKTYVINLYRVYRTSKKLQ